MAIRTIVILFLSVLAPGVAYPSGLEILKAEYGANSTFIDVSDAVRAKIVNDAIDVQVTTVNLGGRDPIRNVAKKLRISYRYGGSEQTAIVSEFAYLKIGNMGVHQLIELPTEQDEDTRALLAKPLTKRLGEKKVPERMRGIHTAMFGWKNQNTTDPGKYISDAYFRRFEEWKINAIRVFIEVDKQSAWNVKKGDTVPPIPAASPIAPYTRHLEALTVTLHRAEQYGIAVMVCLGNVVGRDIDVLYKDKDGVNYQETVLLLWEHIAKEYGGHPNLVAYDLLNEPYGNADTFAQYMNDFLPKMAARIRAYDAATWLVVEPPPFALPDQSFKDLMPLADTKAMYSFHFYYPHNYTHQGIYGKPKTGPYPGMLSNFPGEAAVLWDRAALERSMQNVRDFQRKHRVRIMMGEGGVLRWAPGAEQWADDMVSICEEYGWDWFYGGYGGWNGFNPTFPPDAAQSNEPDGHTDTPLLVSLKKWWAKNRR